MTKTYAMFATAPKGVGDLLAKELMSFGAVEVRESAAGVSFTGTLEVAYRACLWSRVASRILLPLAEFEARGPEDLYRGAATLPWEEHMGPDSTFAVDASGHTGLLTHTHYASLKVKDAIADRFRKLVDRRPSVKLRAPDVRINLYLHRDRARLSLDLSGEALHQRGYRLERGEAPLKENLAAAILLRAGWPSIAADGGTLVDPMCGAGTIPIEAALIAADIAPGILRQTFGFMGWKQHLGSVWTALQVEARYRMKEGLQRLPVIVGYDADRHAVKRALGNLERAGLAGRVHFERRDLVSLAPPSARARAGLVVVNPPYGERMGDVRELRALYALIGEKLRTAFVGWKAAIFTANPDLAREVGLKAVKANNLYNGSLNCRLLHFDIRSDRAEAPPVMDRPQAKGSEVEMFANRIRKNLRTLGRWSQKQGVTCYRLYDADVPEFNLAVDLYGRWAHVQEYEAPLGVDPGRALARREDAVAFLSEILSTPPERIILKVRKRQKDRAQYEKLGDSGRRFEVTESGLKFLVNLEDYLDTGLYLDSRDTRRLIGALSSSKNFLNLFCYTGTATVYAAAGGARSTTSVDLSNRYLKWAQDNLRLNGLDGPSHRFFRADVVQWLSREKASYDLIFLDPPSYSRSKGMEGDFDVQRDHAKIISLAARLLDLDGTIIFSTNRRKFEMDSASLEGLQIEDITRRTIPRDFERRPDIHHCWMIRKPRKGGSESFREGVIR